jgi:hypothetical protein
MALGAVAPSEMQLPEHSSHEVQMSSFISRVGEGRTFWLIAGGRRARASP